MKPKKMLLVLIIAFSPCFTFAQIKTLPNAKPDLQVNPKLKINTTAQKLTNGSRKRWILKGITTNGYKREIAGSCYEDNELFLSSDQSANYSEGKNMCQNGSSVNDMKWQLSIDGKKLTLTGIPITKKDNTLAMVGFLLGNESEILELTDTTLKIKFKGSDGYIDRNLNVVTNEIIYTAK
jgi:hypothetical protein